MTLSLAVLGTALLVGTLLVLLVERRRTDLPDYADPDVDDVSLDAMLDPAAADVPDQLHPPRILPQDRP